MDIRLLPTQKKVYLSKAPYPAYVGGYGSGKSHTLVTCALRDMVLNPNGIIGVFAPTYDLLKLILIPRFEHVLTEAGIKFTLNKSDYTITASGVGDLIFRSLDNPDRIVGFEICTAHIDELDTLSTEKAANAWRKVLARTRAIAAGGRNTVNVYTTPEGKKFVYQKWGKNSSPAYELIKAKTSEKYHIIFSLLSYSLQQMASI